jgi:maleylpyruvate isomerase
MNDVLRELTGRTGALVDALDGADLRAPSKLPGWSRLTIACHLRYGAEAFAWMTADAVAGRPTSYYPAGRATQRPGTLEPRADERPIDVVSSLRDASAALDDAWAAVDDWSTAVTEPADNPDLGTLDLGRLPLARLTEIEVHGTDLGLGLGPWSEVLVRHALPMRLEWLNTRRSNHRQVDVTIRASWLLVATDGPVRQIVAVNGPAVRSFPAADTEEVDAVIEGTGRELLALLLGRAPVGFAPEAFARALPGP